MELRDLAEGLLVPTARLPFKQEMLSQRSLIDGLVHVRRAFIDGLDIDVRVAGLLLQRLRCSLSRVVIADVSSEASTTGSFQLLELLVFVIIHEGRRALATWQRLLVHSCHHIMDRQLAVPQLVVALLFGAAIDFGASLWAQKILVV